jgi:hypothetical protein
MENVVVSFKTLSRNFAEGRRNTTKKRGSSVSKPKCESGISTMYQKHFLLNLFARSLRVSFLTTGVGMWVVVTDCQWAVKDEHLLLKICGGLLRIRKRK